MTDERFNELLDKVSKVFMELRHNFPECYETLNAQRESLVNSLQFDQSIQKIQDSIAAIRNDMAGIVAGEK